MTADKFKIKKSEDNIFNQYENEEADWKDRLPRPRIKNEFEIYAPLINPASKTSLQIMKGRDPDTNEIKTGYGYSGFDEANNSDLTTANLYDDLNVGSEYINSCNILLTVLEDLQVMYGINVKPSHDLILRQRSLYLSMSKSINAKLLDALTISRSESLSRSQDLTARNPPKKKALFSLGGNKEPQYNTQY